MASYFYLRSLCSSARFALVRTSLRGTCSPGPKGSTVDELLVGDPHGVVDVTSRYRFRAAGLSMVVMPERRIVVREGLPTDDPPEPLTAEARPRRDDRLERGGSGSPVSRAAAADLGKVHLSFDLS